MLLSQFQWVFGVHTATVAATSAASSSSNINTNNRSHWKNPLLNPENKTKMLIEVNGE